MKARVCDVMGGAGGLNIVTAHDKGKEGGKNISKCE